MNKRTYTKDKDYRFNIRLSQTDYEHLNRLAYARQVPMAELVRQTIQQIGNNVKTV